MSRTKSKKELSKKRVILGLIFILLSFLMLVMSFFMSQNPSVAEYYAGTVFPFLTYPFVFLANLNPISMTEVFVVSLAISSPLLLIWLFYRFARSKQKKKFAAKGFLAMSSVVLCLTIIFNLFHGFNYSRYPLEKTLNIENDLLEHSVDDLTEVLEWIVIGLDQSLMELDKDHNGQTVLLTDKKSMFIDASEAMNIAGESINDALCGHDVRPKPVALSSRWSYTQISGMYNPFFMEANINIDIPQYRLPMVVTHEIAHVRGIAREGDANLAAFLACISSPRADFRYSGYLFAYGYIANDLYRADPEVYFEVVSGLPERVHTDLAAAAEYWQQFDGRVSEVSTQVNDSYLRVNRQDEGVLSYSLVSELIVSYYNVYEPDEYYD